MTNKIINGVDVSEYFANHYDNSGELYAVEYKGNPLELQNAIKRLQEENKRLQMLSCANCGENYLSPEGAELYEENVRLQQQIEAYQLSENEAKEIIAEFKHKNKELKKENENLKYEIDRHKDTIYYLNNRDMCLKTLIRYKQALEEIRNYCDEQNLKADYTACYITNRIDEVLDDQN